MFEQAVLPSRPTGGRYWTVAAGLTGELLVVGFVMLAPLIWTDFLPHARALNWISLPSPPPPELKAALPARIVHSTRPWQSNGRILIQPRAIPATPLVIEDPPSAEPCVPSNAGVQGAPASAVLSLLNSLVRVAPPEQRFAEPAVSRPAPTAPRRISAMHPARLLHRVEPMYPALARSARISGTVELTGVIATDGCVRELRVVSGHPFLAQAALEAVRQWIYEPTVLNGDPVEVVAPITVHFYLK